MKTNKEILDDFGRILVYTAYEINYEVLTKNINRNIKSGELERKVDTIAKNSIEGLLFCVLKVFEENEQFKLIYEEDGKQVDLNKISEMLKAELLTEDGWIARFSKYAKDEDF